MAGPQVSGQIADRASAVTKSDTAANAFSYLYVGTAGNVTVVTEGGDEVIFKNVPSGAFLWVRTSKIKAATTAADIVGFL